MTLSPADFTGPSHFLPSIDELESAGIADARPVA
jgi:hypothetical protein